jgi:penicillin amidase
LIPKLCMKILKRILIGIVALLLLVIIATIIYLQMQGPNYSGDVILRGLKSEVEINYDEYGVPHIYAQNAEDAYFALGYAHAQDRLFQMEMLRRAASGRLSEVLGPDLLKVDKLFRTLSINEFAKVQAQQFLNSDTADFQRAALAYQKGLNEYVRTGKTPLEFTLMGIPKTEFTPQDIYHAIGFMSFGFAEGLRADPVLQKIKTEYGDDYLKELAITTPPDAERIKSFKGPGKILKTDSLITAIDEALRQLPVPLWQGSNGWVISGDRTASGLPVLANDTHMGYAQPAVWYEAHIEYPGFSFYGHHVAGIPFALLGNNDFSGWGLTMFENDDTDFFAETLNPDNANQVKFKDQWEEIKTRKEIIKVKGQADVELNVKSTRHGIVINGILGELKETDEPVALWWILNHTPNQALQAAYTLNHTKTFEDAKNAASLFSAPGLNVMYGDKAGNIAWWAVAKLPIRAPHVQSKLFLDGSSGNDEYLGFYDFSKNPQSINPPNGFVYSANNQPDTVNGILYPGYYYPRARARRIVDLLNENRKWNIDEVKKVNLDVVSITHPLVAKELANVLQQSNRPEFKPLIEILEKWSGDHGMNDVGPSVYYNMLSQTMHLSMMDELGKDAFKSIMATSIVKNSYLTFIQHDHSPWWDNVKTKDVKETRQQIIEKAAINTLTLLKKTSGEQSDQWTWNKIHTITYTHTLAAVKPLDKIFNIGPFAVNGGSEVINNQSFDLDTTGYYPVKSGPSLRKITDFADMEHGVTCSPTGQSGNVMSKYYGDQAEMFVTGKFRTMLMARKEIEAQSKKLKLQPAQ